MAASLANMNAVNRVCQGTANLNTAAHTAYVSSDGFLTGDLYIGYSTGKTAGLIWVYDGSNWNCIVQVTASSTCPAAKN